MLSFSEVKGNTNMTSEIENIPSWLVEQYRVTAFFETQKDHLADSWSKLFGATPEKITQHPRGGFIRYEGMADNTKVIGTQGSNRLDWFFLNLHSSEIDISSLPSFATTANEIREKAKLTIPSPKESSFFRLAIGEVLLIPVQDRVSGYRELQKFLSCLRLDPEGSSDLIYQINRPKILSLNGSDIRINRISKWSVMKRQEVQMQFTPGMNIPPQLLPDSDCMAIRLEIDINTHPEDGEKVKSLDPLEIMNELERAGNEIAIYGDRIAK